MTTTAKITGAAGVLSAVPTVLGFHPSDSVVVVGLVRQPDGRHLVGPVARIDLADAARLGQVGDSLARHADRAIVVVYSDDPDAALGVDTARLGLPVVDLIGAPNAPAELDPTLAAANALAGRRTLRSRAELVAAIAYDRRTAATPVPFTPTGRDAYVQALAADRDAAVAAVPVLTRALVALPSLPGAAADVAAVLAVAAYLSGDGALANVAIDRAMEADPRHTMAHLMAATVLNAIEPADLAAALTAPPV